MKNFIKQNGIITLLFLLNHTASFAAQPNQVVLKNCSKKIEMSVLKLYRSLGYSSKINFIDTIALLSYRTYENGTIVGEFSTPPLSEENIDGYYQSTGATILAGFNKKSCDLLEVRLSTGFESKFQISLETDKFKIDFN